MKWSDHKRVTRYVLEGIQLRFGNKNKVIESNLLTDVHPDYVNGKRVAHHSKEGLKIGIAYLKDSKEKYLKNESYEMELGRPYITFKISALQTSMILKVESTIGLKNYSGRYPRKRFVSMFYMSKKILKTNAQPWMKYIKPPFLGEKGEDLIRPSSVQCV